VVSAAPYRTDCMDHPLGGQPESGRNACLARGTAAEFAASLQQLRPGGAVDCAVHAATAEQSGIGGIDDCIDPLAGNILEYYGNPGPHSPEHSLFPTLTCRNRVPHNPVLTDYKTHMNQTATNMAATNILVVDDDQRLRDLLNRYLGEQGFDVHAVASAPAMDKVMGKEDVDMIILDLMLPGEDGMSVCRRLRAAGRRTPIIMLTAKGDEADRIAGLDVGADDYLPKPFNPRELVARINAVLRRQSPVASSPAAAPGAPDDSRKPVKFGPFEINLSTRTLTRNGKQVGLTTGEFAMLKTLVTHPRVPLSRDRLMELARGREYGVFDRSIDVQVSRLRRLLEEDPAHPRYIQTVWGVGYVFVPDDSEYNPPEP